MFEKKETIYKDTLFRVEKSDIYGYKVYFMPKMYADYIYLGSIINIDENDLINNLNIFRDFFDVLFYRGYEIGEKEGETLGKEALQIKIRQLLGIKDNREVDNDND